MKLSSSLALTCLFLYTCSAERNVVTRTAIIVDEGSTTTMTVTSTKPTEISETTSSDELITTTTIEPPSSDDLVTTTTIEPPSFDGSVTTTSIETTTIIEETNSIDPVTTTTVPATTTTIAVETLTSSPSVEISTSTVYETTVTLSEYWQFWTDSAESYMQNVHHQTSVTTGEALVSLAEALESAVSSIRTRSDHIEAENELATALPNAMAAAETHANGEQRAVFEYVTPTNPPTYFTYLPLKNQGQVLDEQRQLSSVATTALQPFIDGTPMMSPTATITVVAAAKRMGTVKLGFAGIVAAAGLGVVAVL